MTSDQKSVCTWRAIAPAFRPKGGWPRFARARRGWPGKSRAASKFGVVRRTVRSIFNLFLCLHIALSISEMGETFEGGPGVGGVAA